MRMTNGNDILIVIVIVIVILIFIFIYTLIYTLTFIFIIIIIIFIMFIFFIAMIIDTIYIIITDTIFMNTENSKTNESHRFRSDLTDKLNLKNP